MPNLSDLELKRLNNRVDAMVKDGERRTEEWRPMYERGLDYMFNNQTAGLEVKEGYDRIQSNELYPAAMQEMALMLQRRVSIVAKPATETEEDEVAAKVWNQRLRWELKKNLRMPMWLTKARLDGKVAGFWVGKVYWEPKAAWDAEERRWKGRNRLSLIKPIYFGVDPDAEDLDDAEFVFIKYKISLAKAVSRWPKMKAEIEAAADRELEADVAAGGALSLSGAGSRIALDGAEVQGEPGKVPPEAPEGFLAGFIRGNTKKDYRPNADADENMKPAMVTITEIHFKDREERGTAETWPRPIEAMQQNGEIELQDREGGQAWVFPDTGEMLEKDNWPNDVIAAADEPFFPRGRYVVRAGDAILNPDRVDQVWPHRLWPYVIGLHYPLPHVWQGLNGVEMARGMQDFRNIGFIHVLNHLKHFSDPTWIVEEGALANAPEGGEEAEKELTSRAGSIILAAANRSGGVNVVKPPPLGEGAPVAIKMSGDAIRTTTGVHETFEGKKSQGKTTATEVMKLETNTRLRSGLQAFYEDVFVVDVMARVLELSQRHLDAGDLVEGLDEKLKASVLTLEQTDIDASLDLDLEITSDLPYDREREKIEADKIYAVVGLPYLPRLLDVYQVKNADEVLEQMPDWIAYQQFRMALDAADQQEEAAAAGPAAAERTGGA